MRVLVVHNRYRSEMPSGENRVVDEDVSMLRDAGAEVHTFFRDSDTIAEYGAARKAALAPSPTYSVEAVRDFRRVLSRFRPDVVHLHNPFPLISPWVIRIAEQARIPVVQTVHNYRHFVPGLDGILPQRANLRRLRREVVSVAECDARLLSRVARGLPFDGVRNAGAPTDVATRKPVPRSK